MDKSETAQDAKGLWDKAGDCWNDPSKIGSGRDEWHVAKLDGVHFDWRGDDRVILTWRARFPLPDAGETRLTLASVVFAEEAQNNAEAAE